MIDIKSKSKTVKTASDMVADYLNRDLHRKVNPDPKALGQIVDADFMKARYKAYFPVACMMEIFAYNYASRNHQSNAGNIYSLVVALEDCRSRYNAASGVLSTMLTNYMNSYCTSGFLAYHFVKLYWLVLFHKMVTEQSYNPATAVTTAAYTSIQQSAGLGLVKSLTPSYVEIKTMFGSNLVTVNAATFSTSNAYMPWEDIISWWYKRGGDFRAFLRVPPTIDTDFTVGYQTREGESVYYMESGGGSTMNNENVCLLFYHTFQAYTQYIPAEVADSSIMTVSPGANCFRPRTFHYYPSLVNIAVDSFDLATTVGDYRKALPYVSVTYPNTGGGGMYAIGGLNLTSGMTVTVDDPLSTADTGLTYYTAMASGVESNIYPQWSRYPGQGQVTGALHNFVKCVDLTPSGMGYFVIDNAGTTQDYWSAFEWPAKSGSRGVKTHALLFMGPAMVIIEFDSRTMPNKFVSIPPMFYHSLRNQLVYNPIIPSSEPIAVFTNGLTYDHTVPADGSACHLKWKYLAKPILRSHLTPTPAARHRVIYSQYGSLPTSETVPWISTFRLNLTNLYLGGSTAHQSSYAKSLLPDILPYYSM